MRSLHSMALILGAVWTATSANAQWDARFFLPGIQGEVRATAVSGQEVYAGGLFTSADDLAVTNLAKWNGTNWSALGSGPNGTVNAIAIYGNDCFVGGTFTAVGGVSANRIAKWNGAGWVSLGSGIEGPRVTALAVDAAGLLYAGGEFTNAGGVVVANIARWDGTNWSALGTGLSNDPYAAWVLALATRGTELYAGGFFTDADGVSVSCIAKWNGTAWSALGTGVDDLDYLPQVTALAATGNDLYVGGAFTKAGNVSAAHVAKWSGASWSALDGGLTRFYGDIPVAALALSGDDLLVGGRFEMAGGTNAINLARWDGTKWSEFAGGASGSLNAVVATGGTNVLVGGAFFVGGHVRPDALAQWNGSEWTMISASGGEGIYGPRTCVTTADCFGDDVATLALDGGDLVAAGGFVLVGDLGVSNIACWDGTNWSPVGSGVNGYVRALARADTALYAAGRFSLFGGTTSSNIAVWNGAAWLPLGDGISGPVHALAVSGNDLYAGGVFTTAGGVTASNVARWNGTNWSALASGVNGAVYALAVSGSNLYVGGKFTVAGGVGASNVACWNGSNWSALGGGVGGVVNSLVRIRPPPVSALAVRDYGLFVGGDFAWAGGVAATNIAKWDGTDWSGLGAGVLAASAFAPPPTVRAFLADGSDLYIGGSFNSAGGLPARNLAKWDGSNWTVFGEGIRSAVSSPPSVEALAFAGDKLYVGGHFQFAGGKPASGFSIWRQPQPPRIAVARAGEAVIVSWPAAANDYSLQVTETFSPPQWRALTNITTIVGDQNVLTNDSPQPLGFFRLIKH